MKLNIAFIFLVLASLACVTQIPPIPNTGVKIEPTYQQIPVKVVISEPTEAGPVWITTGALNVRSQANADSEILGTLAPYTEIQIFIIDQLGDDCYGGEWYAISSPIEGFVCSLWVVRK